MMFNQCLFQEASLSIVREFKINVYEYSTSYYVSNSIETICSSALEAIKA